jgi:hypothetical protein
VLAVYFEIQEKLKDTLPPPPGRFISLEIFLDLERFREQAIGRSPK